METEQNAESVACDHPSDAVYWNPYNAVNQCHRCGHVMGRAAISPEEWQKGVETAVCLIQGCDYLDVDPRGPVFLRDDPWPYYACTEHWEAIMGILGRQRSGEDAHHCTPEHSDGDEGKG